MAVAMLLVVVGLLLLIASPRCNAYIASSKLGHTSRVLVPYTSSPVLQRTRTSSRPELSAIAFPSVALVKDVLLSSGVLSTTALGNSIRAGTLILASVLATFRSKITMNMKKKLGHF
jgi:hypothetical protein